MDRSDSKHLVRGVVILGALGGAAAAASCNLVIGADDYAVGPWGCVLEDAGAPVPHGMVNLTVNALSYVDQTTSNEPAMVTACDPTDLPPCANSHVTAILASGTATLQVPSGFQGFLYVRPTDTPCSAADAGTFDPIQCGDSVDPAHDCNIELIVQLSWPIVSDTSMSFPLGKYSDYRTATLCGGGGVDDERGAIWVNVEDCFGNPAPGVLLKQTLAMAALPPAPDQFCLMNGRPNGYPPGAAPGLTTADGVCGWSDMPVGTVTITASLPGAPVTVASMSTLVLTRTLTYVTLKP
jgi:hypothetical protein